MSTVSELVIVEEIAFGCAGIANACDSNNLGVSSCRMVFIDIGIKPTRMCLFKFCSGGAEMGSVSTLVIIEEIAYGCAGMAIACDSNNLGVSTCIIYW